MTTTNTTTTSTAAAAANNNINNVTSSSHPAWTERLPDAFGIRQAVRQSKYRWCVRESALWGITTGTAMSLHRLRMRSATATAVNMGFLSFFTVYVGSYYFCVKRRDYRERMIELMMQLNAFAPASEMPEPLPIDEHHPFVAPVVDSEQASSERGIPVQRQYVANLPERKEWQKPLPTQEVAAVFQEEKPLMLTKK